MTRKTSAQSNARELEKLYATKARGTKYQTVLRLVRTVGYAGAAAQLEAWGHKLTEEIGQADTAPALTPSADHPMGFVQVEPEVVYVRRRP